MQRFIFRCSLIVQSYVYAFNWFEWYLCCHFFCCACCLLSVHTMLSARAMPIPYAACTTWAVPLYKQISLHPEWNFCSNRLKYDNKALKQYIFLKVQRVFCFRFYFSCDILEVQKIAGQRFLVFMWVLLCFWFWKRYSEQHEELFATAVCGQKSPTGYLDSSHNYITSR